MPDETSNDEGASPVTAQESAAAVQLDYAPVDADLPGIDTPEGSEQRFKVYVPSPDSLFTIGSVATNDALNAPAGPGGFAFRTVENLAAEIHKRTILDTDEDTIIHTGKTLSAVAEELMSLSSNGDYQLGVKKSLDITADPGAGFSDPALTIVPEMGVPDPPPVDTAGPRKTTELQKKVWEGVWTGWEFFDDGLSIVEFAKKRELATGLGKDVFAKKAHKVYSEVMKVKGLLETAVSACTAALVAAGIMDDEEKPEGSKVTIHATDGVTMTTPANIVGFASGGVSFGSPKKVGIKGGLGASVTAGVGASVSGLVSAKLEGKVFTTVEGGKLLTMKADLCELNAGKIAHMGAKEKFSITSGDTMAMTATNYLAVTAKDLLVGAEASIDMASDDKIEIRALKKSTLQGDEKVTVRTEGGGDILLQIGDSDDKIEMGPDLVSINSKSHAELVAGSSYVEVGKNKVDVSSTNVHVKGQIKLG